MDVTDVDVNVSVASCASSNHSKLSTSCMPSSDPSTNINSSTNQPTSNLNVINVCDDTNTNHGIIITDPQESGGFYDAIKLEESGGATAIIYETIVIENPSTQSHELMNFVTGNNNKLIANKNMSLEGVGNGGIIVLTGSLNELLLSQSGHVITNVSQSSNGAGANNKCLNDVKTNKNHIQSIVLNLNSPPSASATTIGGQVPSGAQKSLMLSISQNQQVSYLCPKPDTLSSIKNDFLIQLLFSSMQDEYSMYSKVHTTSAGPQMPAALNQQQHNPPTSVQYVIQGGKMPNMFATNVEHHFESSIPSQGAMMSGGGMRIKEEPESPTTRNLPATPKSNEPPCNQQGDGSEGHEHQEEDEKSAENKHFILAPTPAQLGKAPLQRRLNRGDFLDEFQEDEQFFTNRVFAANSSSSSSMPDTPTMESITKSVADTIINPVPSALPTPTSANFDDFQNQMSPLVKSKMYKKLKTDDMDK